MTRRFHHRRGFPLNRSRSWRALFLGLVLAVVGANYLAQIPYYSRIYYFPRHAPPSPTGVALLGLTLVWFLAGFVGLARGQRVGFWLLLTYLVAVVAFYLGNLINQVAHGYAPFFHLQTHDPVLFMVFGIGYLNLVAGSSFLVGMVWYHRAPLNATVPVRASGAGANARAAAGRPEHRP